MLKQLLVLLSLSVTSTIWSQVSYQDIKHQYVRVCGVQDSTTIFGNVEFVDSVSQLTLTDGMDEFLNDYAMAYYSKYLKTKNRNDLIISINAHTRRWERFGSTAALYNMASGYAAFDCVLARKYLDLLEGKIETHELDFEENEALYTEQIAFIREYLCPE